MSAPFVTIHKRRVGYTVVEEEAMWRRYRWRPTLAWARRLGRRLKHQHDVPGVEVEEVR